MSLILTEGLVVGLAVAFLQIVMLAGAAFAVSLRRRQRELALLSAAGAEPGDLTRPSSPRGSCWAGSVRWWASCSRGWCWSSVDRCSNGSSVGRWQPSRRWSWRSCWSHRGALRSGCRERRARPDGRAHPVGQGPARSRLGERRPGARSGHGMGPAPGPIGARGGGADRGGGAVPGGVPDRGRGGARRSGGWPIWALGLAVIVCEVGVVLLAPLVLAGCVPPLPGAAAGRSARKPGRRPQSAAQLVRGGGRCDGGRTARGVPDVAELGGVGGSGRVPARGRPGGRCPRTIHRPGPMGRAGAPRTCPRSPRSSPMPRWP